MRLLFFILISLLGLLFVDTTTLSSTVRNKRAVIFYDPFGPTYYGIKCGDRVYPQYQLYAAAKKACESWKKDLNNRIHGDVLFQTLESKKRDIAFSQFRFVLEGFRAPYLLYPILSNGELFEDGKKIPIGPDRVVANRNCELVTVLTDTKYPGSRGTSPGPSSPGRDSSDSNGSYDSDIEDNLEFEFQSPGTPNLPETGMVSPGGNSPERDFTGSDTPRRNSKNRISSRAITPWYNSPGRDSSGYNAASISSQASSSRRGSNRGRKNHVWDTLASPHPDREAHLGEIRMCLIVKRPSRWDGSSHGLIQP